MLEESISETVSFSIEPHAKTRIYSYDVGAGKELIPEACCQELLASIYSYREFNGFSKELKIGVNSCVLHLNEKSAIISNYDYKVVADRHFRYTCTFTSDDFIGADICE